MCVWGRGLFDDVLSIALNGRMMNWKGLGRNGCWPDLGMMIKAAP
jgi:hypothetical protein